MPGNPEKEQMKEAVKEVLDERAVTYAQGAVQFANAVTASWSGLIDAFDGFFLRNFVEDQPEAGQAVLDARLAAARQARDHMTQKVAELESHARTWRTKDPNRPAPAEPSARPPKGSGDTGRKRGG
jgi:hypothetical protein